MKTLTFLFAMLITTTVFGNRNKPQQMMLSTRMDVFYFKVNQELVGAELEVYDESGKKIQEQKISSRKVLIDFFDEKPGRYTVKIRKEGSSEENLTVQNPHAFPNSSFSFEVICPK